MEQSEEVAYLGHILDSAKSIEEALANIGREEFDKKRMVQNGLIRELEIIGEAVRHLSDEFRKKHIDIPWEKIFGMRNRLVHDYLGVDLDIVWETVNNFVPILRKQVEEILESL